MPKNITSITNVESTNVVQIFPNPAKDVFKVFREVRNSEHLNVEIFNLEGKMEMSKSDIIDGEQVDISFLNRGMYLIRISSKSEGFIGYEKLVKY